MRVRISVQSVFTLARKLAGPNSDLVQQGIQRMPGQYRGENGTVFVTLFINLNLPYMLLPYLNVLQLTALYLNKNNGRTNSPWHL